MIRLAEQLVAGGARCLQLRNKNATSRELLEQAVALVRFGRAHKTRILINDRADVAWLAKAHGVHVGQSDLSVKQVRKIVGPRRTVGLSTHSLSQAMAATKGQCSYVAVGPIFPTRSKSEPDPVVGLEGLREIRLRVFQPLVAIGGITLENCRDVLAAGADAVAVLSDLLVAPDITEQTQRFMQALGR